ncbi:MAG: Cytochrome c oxidase polypeptide II [uncultured Solirubrobacteraceae bacterium]|uniref:Cytochrome c oxidase subunit 2 n=1 Tax=uncultured Solirubrobacteraceae bacterium TaxID=1162706 RepID=A0A6J4RA70_9ACTN|nr:MAG: Cytochrome c oxidase polypeptide II [uncultured Solirubrobacteraceae bacterium]
MADEEHPKTSRRSRGQLTQMLALGAVASVIGVILGLAIDWFPVQASEEAGQIDRLWDALLIVSVPIFVLVQGIVLYCVWKFRMRPGQENADGPPIHGDTRIEIIWTAIPTVLLVVLCIGAYVVLDDIEDAKGDDTMSVRVVGEQFAWTFYYPREGGEEIASSQLYLPANQSVLFDVQSKDVIHDFWVPAFRMKIDALPGETTQVRATTTDRLGTYPVVCAELCGLGHSVMRQSARVVPPEEFETWLTKQASGDSPDEAEQQGAPAGGPVDGKEIFTDAQPSCASCHTLADAGSNSPIGPNLDDSLEDKDREYIERAIVEPSADIASGFEDGIMPPNYDETLEPEEVDALVDYLVKVTK